MHVRKYNFDDKRNRIIFHDNLISSGIIWEIGFALSINRRDIN